MLTEEQRQARKQGIGGSDVAAILGLSKYKTPIDIFLEKTTDYVKPVNDKSQLRMDIGNALEPVLIKKFQERNNLKAVLNEGAFFNDKYPYLLANIDAVIVKCALEYDGIEIEPVAILEIKTARQRTDEWGEAGTNIIPMEYLCQVAHYCMVTELPTAYISVFFKQSEEIIDYVYHRDTKLETYLLEKLTYFWERNVLKNILPDVQSVSDIQFSYKDIEVIKLKIEDMNMVESYRALSERIKLLEVEKEKFKTQIVTRLGGYGKIVDWKEEPIGSFVNQLRNSVDMKKLKNEYPEIYYECLKSNYSPTLRIK